jgi:putative polyhydroxyalkanoate system protein
LSAGGAETARRKIARIDLHAHHSLSQEQAREAAGELSRKLAGRFDVDYRWQGDTLYSELPGVHGQIRIEAGELWIRARLGFMLQALKRPIERTVMEYLRTHYGCRFGQPH